MKISSRGQLADIFDAFDPGYVRSRYALRATLAMFTSWAIVYLISQQLDFDVFGLGVFTIVASFVCNFIMSEVGAEKRITALGTTLLALFVAMVLVIILNRNNVLILITVISVFFLAYYARKYSLALHLMGFIAVAGFYFAWVFDVNQGNFGPFFLAVIIAALSNLLFWSVLMPPRPISAIRRAIASYYLRSAVILSDLGTGLELVKHSATNNKRMKQQLRRLERSLRMIEGILPEVLGRTGLSDRLETIRTALFSTSRAIRLISNEIEDFVMRKSVATDDHCVKIVESLRQIALWLRKGAPSEDRDRLGSYLKDALKEISSSTREGEGKAHASLLLIVAELYTLFENACAIKSISDEIQKIPANKAIDKKVVKAEVKKRPLLQTTRIGGWTVSVPSLMAVQALAAGLIALGIGYALGLFPLYQTFWFALVTVAGSLGETRLKSLSRIIGTASGIILGLVLAFLIGDTVFLLIIAVLTAFFFLEFSRTVSLNWFICFLSTVLVLAMSGAGADPVAFSASLIISSVVGVGAALLSTTVLFPIKIRDRYNSALSGYLMSLEDSLQAYLASHKDGRVGVPEKAVSVQAEKFEILKQVSQGNLIESNPFSSLDRERSYEMTTILESLNDAALKLRAGTGAVRATSLHPPTVIRSIIEAIGRNILSIEVYIRDTRSVPSIDDGGEMIREWMEGEVGKNRELLDQPYRRDIFPLMDIHDILQVLAKTLTKKI